MRKVRTCLVIMLLSVAVSGCSALNEFFNPPERDVEAEFVGGLNDLGGDMVNILENEDAMPPGHLLGDVELEINKEDKKYLEDKCSTCHKLDRVFLTHRAPHAVWERILDEPQHHDMELTQADKDRLYKIFPQAKEKGK